MTNKEQLIKNIALMDPGKKLNALKLYMNYWVDNWPYCTLSFREFLLKKHRKIIPGTLEYFRERATHCFYCNRQYTQEEAFKKSIDHWVPKSKGATEKYVICCADCNSRKGNTSPLELITNFIKAGLQNKTMWGYHGKKLSFIAGQIELVTNDILYNRGPSIYYFKR